MSSGLNSAVDEILLRRQKTLASFFEENKVEEEEKSLWMSQLELSLRAGRFVGSRRLRLRRFASRCPGVFCGVVARLLLLGCLVWLLAGVMASGAGRESSLEQVEREEEALLTWTMLLRRISVWLGLHKLQLVQELALSESDCFVPNPLQPLLQRAKSTAKSNNQSQSSTPCCRCTVKVAQSTLRNSTTAQANYIRWTQNQLASPFLVRNGHDKLVEYKTIRQLFLRHRVDFENFGYNRIARLHGGAGVGSVADLFADVEEPPKESIVSWRVSHTEAGRHLRKLVSRPKYIGRNMEIGIVKEVVFFGKNLPTGVSDLRVQLLRELDSVFVIALYGQVMVTLGPKETCDCSHSAMQSVALQPKQLLHFRSSCHSMFVTPINQDSTSTAVLYIGSQH